MGVAVSVAVGVAVGVAVAVGIGVFVEVGVLEGVGVTLGVGVEVGVELEVELPLGVKVRVGVAVTLLVGVGLGVPALITTVSNTPKCWPLSSSRTQTPVNLPVLLGTFNLTEISICWPIETELANGTVCPPIASPWEKTSRKLVVHAQVPLFCTRQVFVNS